MQWKIVIRIAPLCIQEMFDFSIPNNYVSRYKEHFPKEKIYIMRVKKSTLTIPLTPLPLVDWHGQFGPLLVHVVYEWPLTKFITKSSITLCAHLSKVLKTAFLCRCDWRRGNFHQSDVINALGRAGLLSGTTSTNPLSRTLLICNRHHFTQCIQSQEVGGG